MITSLAALAALSLLPPQEPAERLQKQVEECSRAICDRFVFFGGGSGVFISADGYCLTNHHVAGTLKKTSVTLHNGRRHEARLVCTDALGDLALFKIDPPQGETFPHAELGDSDRLEPGQYVIACGNPFGIALPAEDRRMYPTVTLGIISATHRYQSTYFDSIQTDAALNPGNSGGPLVTLDGKLVGINGRIATRYMNRVNSGVGYAIPSNQIRNFLPVMMKGGEGGKAEHGRIDGLLLAAGNTDGEGAWVHDAKAGTTAARVGFQRDDLVISVNGARVFNRERLLGVLGTYPVGTEIDVRVRRGGEEKTLRAKLDRLRLSDVVGDASPKFRVPRGFLGAKVESKDGALRVDYVQPDSPAEAAGMREGDVLLRIDEAPVTSTAEYSARVGRRRPGERLKLTVRRDGREVELQALLGRHPDD